MKPAGSIIRPVVLIAVMFISSSVLSEGLFSLKMGPTWPRDLLGQEKPTAWDASLEYAAVLDRMIWIGVSGNFLWNVRMEENPFTDTTTGISYYNIEEERKSFMFPVSLLIGISPLTHYLVHPSVKFNIGYNSLYYKIAQKQDPENDNAVFEDKDPSGYYYGLFMKISADANLNLGEQTMLFAGMYYQWARLKSAKKSDEYDLYGRRDMSGIGIRLGIRFWL